jgi:phage baseplate assembly protein V
MLDDLYSAVRGLASIGVVTAVSDAGQVQTVTVVTGDGSTRANVEVMTMFGFSALPPAEGAICLLFATGADPANLRALPIACPSARFAGLNPGESVMYGLDGSRVHIKTGGAVEIWAGATLTINAPNVTFNTTTMALNAPGGITAVSPAILSSGSIYAVGDVTSKFGVTNISLSTHDHIDPQGGVTGPPQG